MVTSNESTVFFLFWMLFVKASSAYSGDCGRCEDDWTMCSVVTNCNCEHKSGYACRTSALCDWINEECPPDPIDEKEANDKHGPKTGLIIGCVFGAVFVIIAVAVSFYIWCHRKKIQTTEHQQPTPEPNTVEKQDIDGSDIEKANPPPP